MMIMIVVYLISLYMGMRWNYYCLKSIQGGYAPKSLPIFASLGGLANYSLIILGFFIFKWYIFLPLIIFIALGPLLFFTGGRTSEIIQNNIVRAIKYNIPVGLYLILISLFYWLSYFEFIEGVW
jgi:hypothetical protein